MLQAFSLFAKNFQQFEFSARWIFVFASTLSFYLNAFYVIPDFLIGISNMYGLTFLPMTNAPWKARSFADFWGRTTYYINFIVLNYFYFPIKYYLNGKYFSEKLKPLIFFFAVFIGISYLHLIKDVFLIAQYGSLKSFFNSYFLNRWIYFLGISFFLTLSIGYTKLIEFKINKFVIIPLIFIIYSLLSSSIYLLTHHNIHKAMDFYLSLITFRDVL